MPFPPIRARSFLTLAMLIALAAYILSCTAEAAPCDDPEMKKASLTVNPNGDSELALLMRAMYDDLARMKAAIERGEEPVPGIDHAKMLTAQATEPDKAASDTYKAWAQTYLQMVQSLQNGETGLAPELYRNVVNTCMGCHSDLCPGPKMRIGHLY